MKKILVTILFFLGVSLFGATYSVDKNSSSITFQATKLLFVGVEGKFSDFSGTIEVEDNKISSINGTVMINSIFTDNEKRDTHLNEADYFNSSLYPTMSFKSTSIQGDVLQGVLEIKTFEKELTLKLSDVSIDENNVTLKINGEVNRKDFELDGSMAGLINNEIQINLTLKAVK